MSEEAYVNPGTPPCWTEEPLDQRNVIELLRELLADEPLDGARVIDATAGNGHDTEYLAGAVGPSGHVLALDLQQAAVESTTQRITASPTIAATVVVSQGDHAHLQDLVPHEWKGQVALVMFNLGYLPGGGRELTTQGETSVRAAAAALALLQPGGLLCMAIYTGHPAGMQEAKALRDWAATLPDSNVHVTLIRDAGKDAVGRPEVLLIRQGVDT